MNVPFGEAGPVIGMRVLFAGGNGFSGRLVAFGAKRKVDVECNALGTGLAAREPVRVRQIRVAGGVQRTSIRCESKAVEGRGGPPPI